MLSARLRTEPLVIVAGESGVGKSSLCRAGVLPAVLDGALGGGAGVVGGALRPWPQPAPGPGRRALALLGLDAAGVVRRLRAHPSTISHAIRRRLAEDTGLVLFVDQLEELVTMAGRLPARWARGCSPATWPRACRACAS